ncbi:MAG: oligogalacturonide lyase [Planctomycetes bacterium SM23_32]|nr:MAG: oligogalacturonide lyase [Planctomycetes bacterium SM23_32]
MTAGRKWPPEWEDYEDPSSGVTVRRLTNYKGHSHHLYFTNPGWWDGGRRLLFGSDRQNRSNLFSIELEGGEITQLTDLERDAGFLQACVNPTRPEAYFWYDRAVVALGLHSLELRALWTLPDGFRSTMLNCTADGAFVCAGVVEDLSDRIHVPLRYIYAGFRETHEAHPLCRIMKIGTDGSGADTVWEEENWIGHVNTSPTQPHLLTFCHEGPWDIVDNRIWGLDVTTGRAWRIRPREGAESVGHEYWHADGLYVGYHGHRPDGAQAGRRFFGRVRYDNADRTEVDFPHQTGHIHSNDFSLIVGDGYAGSRAVRLWRWNGEDFDGPRALCEHRSSFHVQEVHVHPRFSPDGSYVIYTSDVTGYGNVYQVAVAEFESLPRLE